jgi:protein-S-isoprenylcysteine O-methyltransferase Ste14
MLGISGYLVSRPKGAWQGNPKALVTSGPYKFVRHPLYASEYLLIFSIALWRQAFWAIFLSPTFLALVFIAAWLEERYILTKHFPDQYREYRRTTPMIFPWWFALLIVSIYLKILVYYIVWPR